MAKLYGEIAAKALLTLDKSFARANGQPLDASEVYYSLQAAKDYAATAQAYIGQKIVVIENGIVTHYSVEDTAGNLKELGAKPVADGTTVDIGADGKITLANITDAEASGTYNAVLVNGKLTWVKPSETTVEGLSDLISALTGRVDTAEADIDALQAAVGVAASEGVEASGLFKAVADEVAAREAADDVLEGKIAEALQAAKDYADANDANTVYDDTALAARVKAIEDDYLVEADKYDDTDVKARIKAIEDDYLKEEDKYDDTALAGRVTTAEGKIADLEAAVEAIDFIDEDELAEAIKDFATDKELSDGLALKADKTALEELASTVDAFLTGDGTEAALDSLKELITYIETHDDVEIADLIADIQAIENKLDGIDSTVVSYVTAAIDALKIGDYAKASDLTALAGRVDALEAKPFDTYATKSEVEAVDGKFANYTTTTDLNGLLADKADADSVVANSVFEQFKSDNTAAIGTAKSEAITDAEGKIATAKQEAITAAATAAEGIYATKTALGNLETAIDERLDVLEAYDHATYATKEELTAHDNAAKATYATKDELKATDDVAKDAQNRVDIVEGKIDEITSVGGEPNVLEKVKVNGVTLEIEKDGEGKSTKTVNISVPTKFSDITDNSGFDARITAAQNDATKGINDAKKAQDAADKAQSEVDDLETVVGNLTTTVTGQGETIADHTTRIGVLEGKETTHAAEYAALKKLAEDNAVAIATKAENADLVSANTEIAKNTAAIKVINETTVPALEEEIGKKANSANVYTKSEVNAITGTLAEHKTLVDMINDAQTAATYNDAEVRGLISDNTGAISTLSGTVTTEIARVEGLVSAEASRAGEIEADHEGRIATMENFWKAADDPEGTIDKLAEIVKYIEDDKSGALDMAADIALLSDAVSDIYAVDDEGVKSGVLVTEIARVEKKADDNATAIAAINNETTGILATAKKYTDDSITGLPAATVDALGLVKFDNTTIKMNDNKQLYVAKVSTDILEMGNDVLVLNGGTAND